VQLGTFISFSNVYQGQYDFKNPDAANKGNLAIIIVLYILAIYFLTMEFL